jgi:acyl carrier protein
MPDVPTRPASRAEFQRALTDLIAVGLSSRRRRGLSVELTAHTPLFESGLVDSLAILELVAFVEAATGRPIPPRAIHIRHFATIDCICAAFWRDRSEVTHANG